MAQAPKPENRLDEEDEEAEGERHFMAIQKFVGFVMLVLAWDRRLGEDDQRRAHRAST